ncbi:MAG: hypothetical protein HKP30_01040 [Myxococcales bacterium]|nr:hypothetical protein [Myxococcales bacterium]
MNAAAAPRPQRVLLVVGALALAVLFQAGLLFGGWLNHFDWYIHWHYYDWVRIGLQEHGQLPRFMLDAWHTPNFVANAQSPVLGPLVGLLAFLPTEVYVKGLVALLTAVGAAGAFALARDLGARPALAACATVLWTCGGYFAAHVAIGHHWSLGSYWLPWLFLALRHAAAGSRRAFLAAAAIEAVTLLEGQHHPFLWQNGLLGLWALFESIRVRGIAPLAALASAALAGALLAGVRLVPVLFEFADYAPEARIGGLPPSALLFSLLSRSQGPATAADFGVLYDHGSGWWEYTFYLGLPGLAFVAVGVWFAGRRFVPLLLAGAVAAFLSFDTTPFGFDLWAWLQHVPVASSQRCPSRLFLLTLFVAIFSATVGWERLLARRALPARMIAIAFTALAVGMAADLVSASRGWQAAAVGPEPQPSRPHRLRPPELAAPATGTVEELEISPNRLRYRVASDRPGFLVFGLRLAGEEQDAWFAEGLPRVATPEGALAVRVPAGSSEVVMRYRTPGLGAGIALSLASLLALGGLGVRRTPLPWRAPPAQPER